MDKKIAFIFPGQGAQYVGMGKDFFDSFSIAKQLFEEANDLLHFNLSEIIFNGPEDSLKKTVNNQVAIFVTAAALLQVLKDELPHIIPNVCAGLSLGEYTALYASNKISFKDALLLIQKRAQFMNDASEKTCGTMAAVIGLDANIIEETIKKINPPNLVWVANYNTVNQTVISGTIEGVEAATAALQEIGAKRVMPLKVSGAFHSGLMIDAQEKMKIQIEATNFESSDIDIIMNVPGDYVRSVENIKKYLILQITNSIRWVQSIAMMEKNKVEIYLEIGPSKTLSMMNRKNNVSGISINLDKISDLEKISHEIR